MFILRNECGSIDYDWCHIFWTSKRKSKNYDVNRRIFYSMRRVDNGYAGMKRFFSSHEPPISNDGEVL